MRKRELVQLHALCSQIRERVERRYDIPDGAFERYDRTDVQPGAIYRGKEAHGEALERLLSDLRRVLAAHVEESSGPIRSGSGQSGTGQSGEAPSKAGRSERRSSREEAVGRWD